MMERPGADSEEKREPVGDIDIAVVDSLKVLDPRRPIREADICQRNPDVRFVSIAGMAGVTIVVRAKREQQRLPMVLRMRSQASLAIRKGRGP